MSLSIYILIIFFFIWVPKKQMKAISQEKSILENVANY